MRPHVFREDLERAETAEAFWEDFFRRAFPDMVGMAICGGDTQGQRLGVDREIALSSGASIKVEQKIRWEWHGDILLEYLSSVEHDTPGWMEKELLADYLAYGVCCPEGQFGWVIPWLPLRTAWLKNREQWIKRFPRIDSRNEGYTTRSVGIPVVALFQAVNQACEIVLFSEVEFRRLRNRGRRG